MKSLCECFIRIWIPEVIILELINPERRISSWVTDPHMKWGRKGLVVGTADVGSKLVMYVIVHVRYTRSEIKSVSVISPLILSVFRDGSILNERSHLYLLYRLFIH